MATIVGTWRFSKSGVEAARASLNEGKSALDAAEAGVKAVELDTTVTSVGLGGFPDAEGNLQLDAALMTGCGRLGSVRAPFEMEKVCLRVSDTDRR